MTVDNLLEILSQVVLAGDRVASVMLADALLDFGYEHAADELRGGKVKGVRVILTEQCEWCRPPYENGPPVGFGTLNKLGCLCEFHRQMCLDMDQHQCSNCGNAEGR